MKQNDPYRGMAWQIQGQADVNSMHKVLGEIAELGADSVLISNAAYQDRVDSTAISIDPLLSPTSEDWGLIVKAAHHEGLRVVLMPIVLLKNPRPGEWRGIIQPRDWSAWFKSYTKYIMYYAGLAAMSGVEVLMIGSELTSAEVNVSSEAWRQLIGDVRSVFPGQISYSVNWDSYQQLSFVSDLDWVGINGYFNLTTDRNPSVETLISSWLTIRLCLERYCERVGKRIVFTEVGWCSQEGTSSQPWNYALDRRATLAGLEEQRRCYYAFMKTWQDRPVVLGTFWWEWSSWSGGTNDYSYCPKDKPAEVELRKWFAME